MSTVERPATHKSAVEDMRAYFLGYVAASRQVDQGKTIPERCNPEILADLQRFEHNKMRQLEDIVQHVTATHIKRCTKPFCDIPRTMLALTTL